MSRKTKKEKLISELRKKVKQVTPPRSSTLSYAFSPSKASVKNTPLLVPAALVIPDLRKTVLIAAVLFSIEYLLFLFFERDGYQMIIKLMK